MSVLKIPFILLDAINMRLNATPPNPPVPLADNIIPDWRERFLKSLARPSALLRAMYWLVGFIEVVVILASQQPSGWVSKRILSILILNGSSPLRIRITPLFIFGNFLGVFGTALRVQCYRTLGRLFTFELCICKDHTLIVSGPYAFIRHPSYTGLILTIVGAYCNNATGSWLKECGLLETLTGKLLLLVWLSIATAVVASLLLRVPREDEILQSKFGDEWEEWAQKVRYRLVPGVY
ncbi:putative protein-S-isoprenylcysteine O-methyltransferase [Hypsizygus marmoreus]|uniref:Protein-S-isoprenylcysteine O-methyltransferase n=1 Tax=Hypsizygus marmoreus TaxID=39966 RepID=A0A369JZQ7_HYPMA|nr:putative protein-S-isoprenylcysteine O-methyltransferase [Hypsizygus marmoreus]